MNVLHINCNYLTTELHQTMVEGLDKLGINNKVFVPTYLNGGYIIRPNENTCISQCIKKWDRLSFFYKQNKIYKSIKSKYDFRQFNIIHAYTLFTDGNVAMRLSKEQKTPYVVTIRNTDVNDFFRFRPYLIGRGVQIMLHASTVFFLSDVYKRTVLTKYVPEKYRIEIEQKSVVVPNGINKFWLDNKVKKIDRQHFERIEKKQINLLYVGKINKNKNIITTLRAIKILEKQGWTFEYTVVGKIEDDTEYMRLKREYPFCYLEAMPPIQLIKQYGKNDIFIMPSHTESFGLTYAEAMSQGLPVIYTRGQGFDGQFDDGTVGYAVDDNSPEEVCNAIVNIANNYYDMSKMCYDIVDKFDWERIVKKYQIIYNSVCKV